MAKPGNFTAYQQLNPVQADFGKTAQESLDTGGRIADRWIALGDRAKKQAQDEKNQISKNFNKDYNSLSEVVTQTKSIDEAFARGINSARDMMGDIYKEAEQNPTVMNTMEWQMKKANLSNYSKNLKLISDRYEKYAQKVSTGMQEGKLSDWNSNVLNDLSSIFEQANLDVKVDKNTGLPIAVIAELDDNDESTGRLKELNLVEILDGRGLNKLVNTFDFKESVIDIGNKLGKREVKEPGSNLTHIEYQLFKDIEPEVRKMIKGFIGTEKNPTDTAKSIWSDQMANRPKKLDINDMKDIEEFYVNAIRGFYDEKNKTTKDYSTGFRYSRATRQDEKEDGFGIQLRTNEEGKPIKEMLYGVKGVPQGDYFQFTIPEPIILGIKGENRQITNLMINDAGEIAYEEVKYRGKISGKPLDPDDVEQGNISGDVLTETSFGGGLNAKEINDIARKLNYRNAQELRKALEDVSRQSGFGVSGKKIIKGF